MRYIQQLRKSLSTPTRGRFAVLVISCGALAATLGFGAVSSAQATADAVAKSLRSRQQFRHYRTTAAVA